MRILLLLVLTLWLPLTQAQPFAEATASCKAPPKAVAKKAAGKAMIRKATTAPKPGKVASQGRSTASKATARKVAPTPRSSVRAVPSGRGKKQRLVTRQRPAIGARPAPVVVVDPSRPPALQSHAALVMRHDTGEILYAKNANEPHAIASVTKLMSAIVALEQGLDMQELVRVSEEDVDTLKNSSSRLPVGTALSREELLTLALMSSENRATSALARTSVPGGLPRFVAAMNRKAQSLGMHDTRFLDPTGLNPGNVSTAADLAKLAQAAYQYPVIRRITTTAESEVYFSNRFLPTEYRNTNSLVRNQLMAIGLSKTGYIREAGRCLVMQANLADDPYLLVFLGSPARSGPAQDALRLERWLSARRSGS